MSNHINLLPPEEKKARHWHKRNATILHWSIIALVLLLASYGVLWTWHQTAEEGKILAKNRVESIEDNLKQFDELRHQARFIADRLALKAAIEKQRTDWTAVLNTLVTSTPQDVAIQAFTPTSQKNGLTFVITGEAGSRASVINLKNSLDTAPEFADVQFETSQLTNTNRVAFTLLGQIKAQAAAGKERNE